jgi:hypothetical protein
MYYADLRRWRCVFKQNIINFPLNIEPYALQMIHDARRSVPLVFADLRVPTSKFPRPPFIDVVVNRFPQDGENK